MKRFLGILCLLALLLTACTRGGYEIRFHIETGSGCSLLTVFSGTDDATIALTCAQSTLRIHAPQASFRLQPNRRYTVSIRAGARPRPCWTVSPLSAESPPAQSSPFARQHLTKKP